MNKLINELKEKIKNIKLKPLVLNIYAICLFLLPIIPDAGKYAEDSRKWWMFNGLTIIAAVILFIISIIEKKLKLNKWDALLGIYLVLVLISAIVSRFDFLIVFTGKYGRGEGLLTLMNYVLTFVIFSKGYKHLKGIIKYGVLAACIVAIYCLFQALLTTNIKWPEGLMPRLHRATGTMRNPNFLSSYMCLFLPMLTFWYINKPGIIKLIANVLVFCGLLTSATLGGYLTCAFVSTMVLIGSIIFSNSKLKVLRNFTVIILLFALLFVILDGVNDGVYTKELIGESTKTGEKLFEEGQSGSGRLFIWKKSIAVLANYKWFGVGPDVLFKEINNIDKYGDNKPIKYKKIDKAHSEPLQIAVTTGIPSMITYLVFVITLGAEMFMNVIKRLKKDDKKLDNPDIVFNVMVFISVLSYFAQSLISISVIHVAPIYWAMLGLGAGSLMIDTNIETKQKNEKNK